MKRVKIAIFFILAAILLVTAGCDQNQATTETKQQTAPTVEAKETVVVYEPTKDGLYVQSKQVMVNKTDNMPLLALETMIATQQADKLSVVPADTKIKSVTVQDGIATVDIDKQSLKKLNGGSTTERLFIGAIVNTLTEFKNIQKVQILLDGKKSATLNGHLSIDNPLARMTTLLEPKK